MNRLLVALLVLWLALAHAPVRAAALEALVTPVPGDVILGFGAAYGVERRVTHRGIDFAGRPRDPVAAPCAGVVVFAGWVPGDCGARVGAVTIQPEKGLLVTVLPLDDVAVAKGDLIGRSECVGTMASQGDDSSPLPHIHLSLRRDGSYVDPAPFLRRSSLGGAVTEDAVEGSQDPEASPPAWSEGVVAPGEPALVKDPKSPAAISVKPAPVHSDVAAGAGLPCRSHSGCAQSVLPDVVAGCGVLRNGTHSAHTGLSCVQDPTVSRAAAAPEEERIVRDAQFHALAAWDGVRANVVACRQVSKAASTRMSSPRLVRWSIPGMATATIMTGVVAAWLQRRPKLVRA